MANKFIIRKTSIIECVVLCAFMEPPLISQITIADNIWLAFKAAAALYVLLYLYKRPRHSLMQGCIILFFGSLVLSTALNDESIVVAIRTVAFNLILCLYTDQLVREKGITALKRFSGITILYIMINAVLLIAFPEGFGSMISGYRLTEDTRLNFLGRDNALIYFFIFGILTTLIAYGLKSIKTYVLIGVTIATMLFVWSGTGLVGCALIVLYLVFACGRKIDKWLGFWPTTIASVFVFVAVVFLRIQNSLASVVTDFLNKDITLSGRTYLWDSTLLYIVKKPLIGFGITAEAMIERHGSYYTPHNLILQILLAGGFVTLAIFFFMYLVAGVKLDRRKHYYANLIAVSIFVYLFASLTEATMNTPYLYMILIIARNIEYIETDMEITKK